MDEERPLIRETERAIADALARGPKWELVYRYERVNDPAYSAAYSASREVALANRARASEMTLGRKPHILIRGWEEDISDELKGHFDRANVGGTRMEPPFYTSPAVL